MRRCTSAASCPFTKPLERSTRESCDAHPSHPAGPAGTGGPASGSHPEPPHASRPAPRPFGKRTSRTPGTPIRILNDFRSAAQFRLIFEEFFWLECGLEIKRQRARALPGIEFALTDRVREQIKKLLPFKPTERAEAGPQRDRRRHGRGPVR